MEKIKTLLWALALCFVTLSVHAQSAADKILGTYEAVQEGKVSKVRFTKNGNGYKCQIFWLAEPKNADGTPKLDTKNPDKAKRSTPSDRIVLIDKVVYKEDGTWTDGKIYDPTNGKTFNVSIKFKDAKTLAVTGSLLVFKKTLYWKKLD